MEEKLYRATTLMTLDIYKDFYRFYYRERLKAFRIAATVIGICLLTAAFFMFYGTFSSVWIALAAWIGLFLIVYPRVAYRRPYKKAKDQKQTTYFSFYDSYVEERTSGEKSRYDYSALLKVAETPRYIFIYHTIESISIVIKSEVKEGADGLCTLLRAKVTSYKTYKTN